MPLSEPLPTTTTGHYTICCKNLSLTLLKMGKNCPKHVELILEINKLLLLHLVGFSLLLYLHWWCTVKHKSSQEYYFQTGSMLFLSVYFSRSIHIQWNRNNQLTVKVCDMEKGISMLSINSDKGLVNIFRRIFDGYLMAEIPDMRDTAGWQCAVDLTYSVYGLMAGFVKKR